MVQYNTEVFRITYGHFIIMENALQFKKYIEENNNIIILTHINPDGDTLSTALALALIIKKQFKKNAAPVYIKHFPDNYKFLPGAEHFVNLNDIDKSVKYDLAIAVDVAAKDRLFEAKEIFDNAENTINLDHHKTNNGFGKLNIIDGNASSAGQVLYDLLTELKINIDKETAICLYTAILTDTGGFKYENTSAKTLITAADLVSAGAEPCSIYRNCYESKPQKLVEFQACAISNAVFSDDGKTAYTIITKDMMNQYSATDDFTDGISEALRQIKTVEISMVLKENDNNHTKVSLRSKNVDISSLAMHFDGGGHKFAAGCTIKKPPEVAVNKLLEYIQREII